MLQFIKVGIFAGFLQLIIVTLVSCLVSVSTLRALVVPATNATTRAELLYIYSPLKWLFLLFAVGIVLTDTKYVAFAATRIRHASRLMRPTIPDHAANTLFVLLALPTAGFAILTLRQPPDFVLALSSYFGTQPAFGSHGRLLRALVWHFSVQSHTLHGGQSTRGPLSASHNWPAPQLHP